MIVFTLRTNFVPLEQPVLEVMLSSWMNSQSLPLTTMLPSMVAVKMLSKAMEMMAGDLIVLVLMCWFDESCLKTKSKFGISSQQLLGGTDAK